MLSKVFQSGTNDSSTSGKIVPLSGVDITDGSLGAVAQAALFTVPMAQQGTTGTVISNSVGYVTSTVTATIAAGAGIDTLFTITSGKNESAAPRLGDFTSCALVFTLTGILAGDLLALSVVSSTGYTVLTSAIMGEDGVYTLRVSPKLNAVDSLVANDFMPETVTITGYYSTANVITVDLAIEWFN